MMPPPVDTLALTFLRPDLLWLLALVPVLLLLRYARRAPALSLSLPPGAALPLGWRARLARLPLLLRLGALCLVVLAMAEPAVRQQRPLETQGIDIMLCLDTSSSMEAQDMDERRSRLDVARDAARAFIETRRDDRIGIVTFARYPDLRCPPTTDHAALLRILDDTKALAPDSPEDATGIGGAVARAAAVLADSGSPSRVVILLTDGEENVAIRGRRDEIPPSHAAQLCARFGVRVYAISAGTGRREANGTLVPIDTRPIQDLTRRTGGSFHVARSAGDVVAVYETIDRLEPAPIEEPSWFYRERHLAFLFWAFCLGVVGMLLGSFGLAVLP